MNPRPKGNPVNSNLKVTMLWNAAGNLVYLGLQWLITVLVVRMNGLVDAGILSLAMSVSAIFQNVALFGVRNYQVSDLEPKYTDSQYVSLRWVTCSLSFLFCFLFTRLNHYSAAQEGCILLFMLFRIAENYVDVLHGIAQKKGRLDLAGKSFLLRGLATFTLFVISYYLKKNLNLSIAFMVLVSFGLIFWFDVKKIRRVSQYCLNIKDKKMKEIMFDCLPLCVYMILFAAVTMIPRYCLEKIMGSEALGGYASVFAPAVLVQAAATYLYVPLLSLFAEYKKNGVDLKYNRLFIKITIIIVTGTIILYIGAEIAGRAVLPVLFGDSILNYVYLFPSVIICTGLTAYNSFLCALATVGRRLSELVIINIIANIVCIVFSVLFIKKYNIIGTSYSLILSQVALLIMLIIINQKNN